MLYLVKKCLINITDGQHCFISVFLTANNSGTNILKPPRQL